MSQPPDGRRKGSLTAAITDPDALKELFYSHAEKRRNIRASEVFLPKDVYDVYLQLYRSSLRMAEALERTLDDGEHQLMMEEARALGHDLPDEDEFREELKSYKAFLKDIDAFRASAMGPDRVALPVDTARKLHTLVDYNCRMVGTVFANTLLTDYLVHFGTMKRQGVAYAGATALQETMDVLMEMHRAKTESGRCVREGRMLKNWPVLVA